MSPPPPLEHDYIGLSDVSKRSSDSKASDSDSLKETELRLGLPGSESSSVGLSLGLHLQPKSGAKRGFFDANNGNKIEVEKNEKKGGNNNNSNNMVKDENKKNQQQINPSAAPAAKAQVVGWPPIRSYRKNTMATNPSKNKENGEGKQGLGFLYVKVSMDGAPYLRKVDLKTYTNYKELSSALGKMFICFTIGQCGSHDVPGRDGLSENGLMDLLTGSEYVLTYEDKDADWMLVGDVPWEMFTDSCKRLRIMKGSDAIGLGARVALEEEVYQDQQLYEDQVADQYVEQVNDDQQC